MEKYLSVYIYRSVYLNKEKKQKIIDRKIDEVYGYTANNVNYNSTQEIVENKWYSKYLVDSFGQNINDKNNPKLHRCAYTCGVSKDRGRDLNISHTPLN